MDSFILISSQTISSATATVTFSSIPTTSNGKTLRDLFLSFTPRVTSLAAYNIRFNSDTNNNYSSVNMAGDGTGTSSSTGTGTAITIGPSLTAATTTLGETNCILQVFDFAQTNKHKTISVRSNRANNGVVALTGRWANTSAITSLTIGLNNSANIDAGTFTLYGIEG
jgi:hypothetical protein